MAELSEEAKVVVGGVVVGFVAVAVVAVWSGHRERPGRAVHSRTGGGPDNHAAHKLSQLEVFGAWMDGGIQDGGIQGDGMGQGGCVQNRPSPVISSTAVETWKRKAVGTAAAQRRQPKHQGPQHHSSSATARRVEVELVKVHHPESGYPSPLSSASSWPVDMVANAPSWYWAWEAPASGIRTSAPPHPPLPPTEAR
ncbi:hypothetical protein EDB80DRAFT_674111 [Ilyonectria destructans]|nr:hypothetical protein EDB80DRAFT_674111 [Ilyonectria destructans]